MKEFLRSQFAHYLIWALSLLVLVVVRPQPWSPLFVGIFAVIMALSLSLMWRSHKETSEEKRRHSLWETRINVLAPIIDVDDDGHLYEWLDPPQWEEVFSMLEQTPKESRSLRKAMQAIAPELVAK